MRLELNGTSASTNVGHKNLPMDALFIFLASFEA
jgi:hypothetical protein